MIKEETTVDQFTGEIISSTKTNIKFCKNTDEFIQVYLKDMSGLMNITTHSEMKVIIWIWKMSSYAEEKQVGNMFTTNGMFFDKLKKQFNIESKTVRNVICKLNKKGLIIKDKGFRGVYYLNPEFFFKGALSDRTKCLKVVTEYKIG